MDIQLNSQLGNGYKSNSQKMRVITEAWAGDNVFCPYCGSCVSHFENNRPAADFYCNECAEEYELKSLGRAFGDKVNDGAYEKLVKRIKSASNPNFFFLHYDELSLKVKDLIIVPKYYFSPSIVEKRNPLRGSARRAGWVGCQILLGQIPSDGRIDVIKDEIPYPKRDVIEKLYRTKFIRDFDIESRGWVLDIMSCINRLEKSTFSLSEMYGFESFLADKYPANKNIRAKIRQQLQMLRDKGFISFEARGTYKKLK